jgi:hypothetical protein
VVEREFIGGVMGSVVVSRGVDPGFVGGGMGSGGCPSRGEIRGVVVMVYNATFNNISVISWRFLGFYVVIAPNVTNICYYIPFGIAVTSLYEKPPLQERYLIFFLATIHYLILQIKYFFQICFFLYIFQHDFCQKYLLIYRNDYIPFRIAVMSLSKKAPLQNKYLFFFLPCTMKN